MGETRNKNPSRGRKRILVVDDHPLMREGVARWISSTPDLEVCGEAESAPQALSLVEKLRPDLVLTDVALSAGNGLELAKDLKALHPALPVLVLSMHDETLYAGRALRAGARGYIMKSVGGDRVVSGIREALQGRIVVSEAMLTQLLAGYGGPPAHPGRAELPQLTDRELEVLQLLGEARSSREIAQQLHLSVKTVQTHRMNLAHKLKLQSAAELLRFALQYVQGDTARVRS